MATDINSAGECLKAVNILFEELKNAKRSLINSETCTVNRNLMQAQLEFLRDNLPETVEKAAEIVQEEETIRTETEQKRKEILESAQTQAQGMVNDATQKSRQMMEQAQYEAKGLEPQKVKLGIRPEHLSITKASKEAIPARVDVSEMMGSSIHLHANADGKDVVLVLQSADLPAAHRTGYAYGTDIRFTFDTNLMHLFDVETGENLI